MEVMKVMKVQSGCVSRCAKVCASITYITFITSLGIALSTPGATATAEEPSSNDIAYPEVLPGRSITFPIDEGSHPDFRTEWWYITGWLQGKDGQPLGFQVTFFRSRPGIDEDNPSRFASKQLLFAHAAISDPRRGELLRSERSARAGFGLAEAAQGNLNVHIDDWSLRKDGDSYRAKIAAEQFELDLTFSSMQAPLLQGRNGFSQKGPNPSSASYYYSLPQMSTRGTLTTERQRTELQGIAWFDHEWSSTIMDEHAAGWDWTGLNLDDGSSVMAFQMRNRAGAEHWAAATWRSDPGGAPANNARSFAPNEITWTPQRHWRSSRTGVEYPVEWKIALGARTLILKPLMDDQENDARGSTGTLYWEGAVLAYDEAGKPIGRGYLELTGYGEKR
jgi:predicted secreted hydrolase